MSAKDLLLAIDNGTQSLKALVFDPQGQLLAREQVKFTPYFSEQPAWAEQDPDVFWQALCRACQGIWQNHRVDKQRIAGVALTTQRGTVVNVDKAGVTKSDVNEALKEAAEGALKGILGYSDLPLVSTDFNGCRPG